MKPASRKLSSAVRWTALGSLALWLLAVAHCSVACGDDCCGLEHTLPVAATSGTNHSIPHNDSFCDSLHSLCPILPAVALVKPDFGLAAVLNFLSTSPLSVLAQPEAPVSRQPPDGERAFTPEVCLGPALHSLAPPVLFLS